MDQESKAVRLLLLIGVSGEMPADWAVYAVGSCSYSAALISRLKREGYISLHCEDGLKGYEVVVKGIVREKAIRYLEDG